MGAKAEKERDEKQKGRVVRPFESESLRHGQVPSGGTGQAFGGGDDDRIVETLKEANKEIAENQKKRKKRGH